MSHDAVIGVSLPDVISLGLNGADGSYTRPWTYFNSHLAYRGRRNGRVARDRERYRLEQG